MTEPSDYFPEVDRVLYKRAPLKRVVCQVRFPQVLRIDSELPAAFQERIRQRFPVFRHGRVPGSPGGEPAQVGGAFTGTGFSFSDERRAMVLQLQSGSLSLTAASTTRWELVAEAVGESLQALVQVYELRYLTRCGLRYSNIFDRRILGLEGASWRELINGDLLGLIREDFFHHHAIDLRNSIRLKEGSEELLLVYGFYRSEKYPDVLAYLLDFDIYRDEHLDADTAIAFIGKAHDRARRIFRWAITDRLHDAMGPEPVPR